MLVGVPVVEAGDGRVPEDEGDQGAAAGRVDRDQAAGSVVHQGLAGVFGRPERQRADVDAEVVDEPFLGAERQAAGRRVQAVRADHQVETARGGALEGHVHAARVGRHLGDGVVEDELGVVPGGVVHDRGQVGPGDLVLAGGHPHPGAVAATTVDETHRGDAGGGRPELGRDAHVGDDRQRGAADVDRVAAGPLPAGALHDGGPESGTGQPVRQGGAGHAGAGDQDSHASTVTALSAELQ